MSFEDEVELITGYNEWVGERRRLGSDLTPEEYLKDRIKQAAVDRISEAILFIDSHGTWDDEARGYRKLDAPAWQPTYRDMREVEKILRGLI